MTGLREILTARRATQLWYVPWLGVAMALMMLRIFAIARVLDLKGFGTYSAGLLVSGTFCMLGCLGLQSMLQRKMPVMLMRQRSKAALILLVQCLAVALACASVSMLASGFVASAAGLAPRALPSALSTAFLSRFFFSSRWKAEAAGTPCATHSRISGVRHAFCALASW